MPNIFHLQLSCLKSILLITRVSHIITARHFLRDNTLVEADFSIWRDYGPSKRHYSVHHVWCLDQENTKDFFEFEIAEYSNGMDVRLSMTQSSLEVLGKQIHLFK